MSEEVKDETPHSEGEGCACDDCGGFNILKHFDIQDDDGPEAVTKKVEAKLGTTIDSMKEKLSQWIVEHAEELTLDMRNIAPLGDYEKLIEDNDGMAEFLKTEAHKPEHWKLYRLRMSDVNKQLIQFVFANLAVDEGETLQGFVFSNKTGIIRHAFASVDE